MAISGSDILSRVRDTLQDTTSVRWTDAELLRYLNDGQREVVNMKPDASALTATFNYPQELYKLYQVMGYV